MNNRISSFGKFVIAGLFISSIIAGVIYGYIFSEINSFSAMQDLRKFQPSVPTKIYDVNGILIAELFK